MLRSGAYRTRYQTRNFFKSIQALRAAHQRLYSAVPIATTQIHRIVNTDESMKTMYIRLPFTYLDKKRFVTDKIVGYRANEGALHMEHSVTCNVVLYDPNAEEITYSVFYGADFTGSGDESMLLERPFEIGPDYDLEALDYNFTFLDVSTVFDAIYLPKSGLSVYEVINLIVQIRCLV